MTYFCPAFFIMVVEVLPINIRSSNNIEGIKVNLNNDPVEYKIVQYADDAVLFLNNKLSIENAIQTIKCFGYLAGTILNLSKTEIMGLGRLNGIDKCIFNINCVTSTKCLGIYVGSNKPLQIARSWNDKIRLKI